MSCSILTIIQCGGAGGGGGVGWNESLYFLTDSESILGTFKKFLAPLKDGAYYCYCAYVLRISRYSDFLSPMLTNTGTFLRGLKLSGESRS